MGQMLLAPFLHAVFMVIVDARIVSVIVGVEAEAEVCCTEETAFIHRR